MGKKVGRFEKGKMLRREVGKKGGCGGRIM